MNKIVNNDASKLILDKINKTKLNDKDDVYNTITILNETLKLYNYRKDIVKVVNSFYDMLVDYQLHNANSFNIFKRKKILNELHNECGIDYLDEECLDKSIKQWVDTSYILHTLAFQSDKINVSFIDKDLKNDMLKNTDELNALCYAKKKLIKNKRVI